jgi:hypothetical protein
LRLSSAFFDAISVISVGLIMLTSLIPVMPAQPEPLPSGIRQVSTKPASADR